MKHNLRKYHCIIFVLKNNENFLTENLNNLIDLSNKFDLIFVTRESKDRTNQILKLNNFFNISFSYDSGYYEALKAGFEFAKNFKYTSWIEFGDIEKINLSEIEKLSDINKEFDYKKSIIFASTYSKKPRRNKILISIFLGKKISDPYSKLRIYNENTFEMLKSTFDYKLYPEYFINLLYKKPDFVEVKTKCNKEKRSWAKFRSNLILKTKFIFYLIFVIPFIKHRDKDKY